MPSSNYFSQSFAGAPCPLVGFNLAQTLAPCISCALSIVLLNWPSFIQLLLRAGVCILLL